MMTNNDNTGVWVFDACACELIYLQHTNPNILNNPTLKKVQRKKNADALEHKCYIWYTIRTDYETLPTLSRSSGLRICILSSQRKPGKHRMMLSLVKKTPTSLHIEWQVHASASTRSTQ